MVAGLFRGWFPPWWTRAQRSDSTVVEIRPIRSPTGKISGFKRIMASLSIACYADAATSKMRRSVQGKLAGACSRPTRFTRLLLSGLLSSTTSAPWDGSARYRVRNQPCDQLDAVHATHALRILSSEHHRDNASQSLRLHV